MMQKVINYAAHNKKKYTSMLGLKTMNFSITIKFSEMIVHIHPYITNDKLADRGKENL
jgi:hypothetical protein